MTDVAIGRHVLGPGRPVFLVAEVSANHNGRYVDAVAIIQAAKDAGADAVKLQTYTADSLTIAHDGPDFLIGKGSPWEGRRLYDLYSEAATPYEWQPRLKVVAEKLGLVFFSTPFDADGVAFLEAMDVPAYKIASFELVDLALIEAASATGKPLIMSTGMAQIEEIELAVETARKAGAGGVALLKCTSSYPAPTSEMNLRTIADLSRRFDVPVGLSDHSLGLVAPVAAVAQGACLIEKHLCLSRSNAGPDSSFSLEPSEFAQMASAVRETQAALGEVKYGASDHERASLVFRRSLYAVKDIAAGELLTSDNVRSIRPGYGLPPKHLGEIIGRTAKVAIARGTPLDFSLVGL
jgi:pseudaminic acid synthase